MIETASVKGGDIRREVGKNGEAHRILAASRGGRDWARFMGFLRASSSLFGSVSFETTGCGCRVNLTAGTFCFLPAPAKGGRLGPLAEGISTGPVRRRLALYRPGGFVCPPLRRLTILLSNAYANLVASPSGLMSSLSW